MLKYSFYQDWKSVEESNRKREQELDTETYILLLNHRDN